MICDSVLNLSPEIRHTQYYTPIYLLYNRLDNIDYWSNIGKSLQPCTVNLDDFDIFSLDNYA